MTDPAQTPTLRPRREHIAFKVTPRDSEVSSSSENTFRAKGGPARHLHDAQDARLYAVEVASLFEVGDDRMTLHPGDALLVPRGVSHVWASVGERGGRILVAFQPAGQIGAFVRVVTAPDAMLPQDPELWRAHGMGLLGPPLVVE